MRNTENTAHQIQTCSKNVIIQTSQEIIDTDIFTTSFR